MDYTDNFSTLEQKIIQKSKGAKIPVMGSFELLPLCNMNCEMCYVRLSREEMNMLGRLRTVPEWLGLAQQMKQAGVLFLLLTGGEPLLYPGFQELYQKLRNMGFILTINTNATLLDEKWAVFFAENKPRRINVTLYGAGESDYEKLCHYREGFAKTIQAVKLLKERNVDVKISFSLTTTNYDKVKEVFSIGAKLDVPVHIDPYMMPATRERIQKYNYQTRLKPEKAAHIALEVLKMQLPDNIYAQYIKQTLWRIQNLDFPRGGRHVSCLAGNCSFTINWQGEMRSCVMMSKPSVSAFDVGFLCAWGKISMQMQKLMINQECTNCLYEPVCKICVAGAFLETGSYDGKPEYLCKYAAEYYRLVLLENERLNKTQL